MSVLAQRLSPGQPSSSAIDGFVAARQHQSNQKLTRINTCQLMYMDVGVWGGGPDGRAKTTFGLICGNDVLLCTWLNLVEGGQSPYPYYAQIGPQGRFDLSAGARKFLEQAREIHRGFVVYNVRSDELLTDPGQPLIIFPDLHIHLYKGQLIDRFQYLPPTAVSAGKFAESARAAGLKEVRDVLSPYYDEPQPPLTSLDEELANAIDIAKHCSAVIVQIGDLYEVWEAEVLLRRECLELIQASADLKERGGFTLRSDEKRMLDTHRIVPRDLRCSLSDFNWRNTRLVPDRLVDQYGADFTHNARICEAIRQAHPILFQGGKDSDLFRYQVNGNHDNQINNFYWINYAPRDYRGNELLGDGTIGAKRQPQEELNTQIGTGDHRIHIEHGHKYDWHNNDVNWWKKDAGFDTVFDFLLGTKGFLAGLREGSLGGTLATGGQKGREFADWWAGTHCYDMRKPGCRRADEVFISSPNVRLFIQGHTHDPQLWMMPFRCSLAEQLPGWREYVLGEYWWGAPYTKHDQYLREKTKEDAQWTASGAY